MRLLFKVNGNWKTLIKSLHLLSVGMLTNIIYDYLFIVDLGIYSYNMKKIKFGNGFTIFLLFFGISVLEAFKTQDWLRVAFWFVVGIGFLVADNLKRA
jgi:hypothetical protein